MNNEILQILFEKQAALNQRVGQNHAGLNDAELTQWIQNYLSALTNEAEELRSWTHWKWWKQYQSKIDREQCKTEIIDMMHFLVSLALPLMDADEFVERYFQKLGLNHHRQNVGYNDEYEKKFKQPGNEDNNALHNNAQQSKYPLFDDV